MAEGLAKKKRQRPLHALWNELHPPPKVPTIEEEQSFVYDTIESAMLNDKKTYKVRERSLHHAKALVEWLKHEHRLRAGIESVDCGMNPSTHDTMYESYLFVEWG